MEAGKAANNSRIFGESFVAMQFDKVLKQTLDQIECIGTIGVTRKKHTVKRRHGLVDRRRWLGWISFFLNLCHNSSGTTGVHALSDALLIGDLLNAYFAPQLSQRFFQFIAPLHA